MRFSFLLIFCCGFTVIAKGQDDYLRIIMQAEALYGQHSYPEVEALLDPLLLESDFLKENNKPDDVLIYYFKSLSVLDRHSQTIQMARRLRTRLSGIKNKRELLILDFYEASALIVLQKHVEGRHLYQGVITGRSALAPSLDSLVVKSYANIAVSYHMEGLWKEAENYYQSTLALLEKDQSDAIYKETKAMVSANYLNLLFDVLNRYHDAALLLKKIMADPFNKQINISNHHLFLMAADYYLAVGEHQKFKDTAFRLEVFYKQQKPVREGDLGYLYMRKALYYTNMGNSTRSVLLARQAEKLMKAEQGLFNYLPDVYEILARNYARMADEQATIQYIDKLIAINAQENRYPSYYPYLIAARYYGALRLTELANCYADSSQSAFIAIADKNEYDQETFHGEMARIHLRLMRADQAAYHLTRLKDLYRANKLFDRFKALEVETGMAYCDLINGQPDQAIERLNGIRALAEQDESPSTDPSIYAQDRYNTPRNINIFMAQAWLLKGRKSFNAQEVDQAWQYYQKAVQNLEQQQGKLMFDMDRISFSGMISDYQEVGFKIAQLRYEINPCETTVDDLISFSQRAKSFALQTSINDRLKKLKSHVAPHLIDEEEQLHNENSYLVAAIQSVRRNENSDSVASILLEKQKLVINKLDDLQKRIKTEYPAFEQTKHISAIKSLKQIQQNLNSNQAVVDYFFHDDECMITLIRKDTFAIIPIEWDGFDQQQITDLLAELSTPFMGLESNRFGNFTRVSSHCYNRLIGPIVPLIGHQHLIIVPHRALFHLPFEVLADCRQGITSFKDIDYLIRRHPISYCTSMTLIPDGRMEPAMVRGVTAFAPDYLKAFHAPMDDPASPQFDQLPGARKEIDRIKQHWPVKEYSQTTGTRASFMQVNNQEQILHLAMHAQTNFEESMQSSLVFTDSIGQYAFLQAFEIYSMRFESPLLTLNACSTGDGRYINNEGVMSLARAFLYAGIPCILTTLWPINDEAGISLMDYFYGNLASHMPKDESLQQAKIRYVDEADPITAHPYYWACYTMLGDTQPLQKRCSPGVYIVFILVLIGLIIFLFRKRVEFRKYRS